MASQKLTSKIIRKVPVILGDVNPNILIKNARVPLKFDIFEGTPSDSKLNDLFDSIKSNKIAIKGPWSTKVDNNKESLNVAFRRGLDLWADVVHVKSQPFVPAHKTGVDFVIIRQNTEGEYSQIEHEAAPGYVEMFKVTTASRSQQIAKFAFDYAWRNGRSHITCIHKANIMKMGDGLFLRTCRDVAKDHPNIRFSDMIVDNAAMQLTMRPHQFDVLVLPNLYGNIMAAIGAGLVGSSAILVGSNYNTDLGVAVFEPAARSAEEHIKDLEYSNPFSFIMAACKMLKHIGEFEIALRIEGALLRVLQHGFSTPDIGGKLNTQQFLDKVLEQINFN